jgi:acyl-coenzyme A thioesterase PaaI-like protein
MDLTALAAALLEPVPAHRTFGIRVLEAADARARVGLTVEEPVTNVIGSLHSSGLAALVDATGLAAIIAAAETPGAFQGVLPLGVLAELAFLAPARGDLVGHAALEGPDLAAARAFLGGDEPRGALSTLVEVRDADDDLVCRGRFDWKLRRPR